MTAHNLSPAREAELTTKIGEAITYYESAFNKRLSPSEVHRLLDEVLDRDKQRVFLSRVGPISEADVLWYKENVVDLWYKENVVDAEVEDEQDKKPSVGKSGKGKKGKSGGKAVEEGEPGDAGAEGSESEIFDE